MRTSSALQLVLEAPHVARDLRPDVRVQADRREALVLAVLRQHLGGDGEKGLRELLAHDLGDAGLVLRVQEREEEADGDGLDARLLQLAHALAAPRSSSSGTSTSPSPVIRSGTVRR